MGEKIITQKKRFDDMLKEVRSGSESARDLVMNVKPHVYLADNALLMGEYGISEANANHIRAKVRKYGQSWGDPDHKWNKQNSVMGGYEDEPFGVKGSTVAYIYAGTGKGRNQFSSNQFNELHASVVHMLKGFTKEDLNTSNIQKGHYFSSVAIEGRRELLPDRNAGVTEKAVNLAYDKARKQTYVKIENAIRNDIKQKRGLKAKPRKLRFTMDMVHSYGGSSGELVGQQIVFVIPQSKSLNEGELNRLETKFKTDLLSTGVLYKNVLSGSFSPSILGRLHDILDWAFKGKHGKVDKPVKKKVKYKSHKKISKDLSFSFDYKVSDVVIKEPESATTRRSTSQIPSNLMALLNARIVGTVIDVMDDPDTLNHITGRFAESVQIVAVKPTSNRMDHILVFYNYMKYPYQTFDPGWAQYRSDRQGPKDIIDTSIRELAAQLTYDKFAITPRLI